MLDAEVIEIVSVAVLSDTAKGCTEAGSLPFRYSFILGASKSSATSYQLDCFAERHVYTEA